MNATVVIPAPRQAQDTVTAAQAGDREAFATIYRTYHGMVYRFLYQRCGHRQLAEDLTGDVFLRALNRINTWTFQGTDFGAWLVTIARNRLADHYRSGRYRLETVTAETPGADDPDVSREGDPATAVADHLINLTLLAAVEELNPHQRECVRLRFLAGLSVAETAAAMGLELGAVKALQYRAVRALAVLLARQGVTP